MKIKHILMLSFQILDTRNMHHNVFTQFLKILMISIFVIKVVNKIISMTYFFITCNYLLVFYEFLNIRLIEVRIRKICQKCLVANVKKTYLEEPIE